jgi:hypothetical protein
MMKRAQPNSGPSINRSEDFIRWRLANPLRTYEFAEVDGAYAIFTRAERFLFINDFWEADRSSGSQIASTLCRLANKEHMKGLLTFGSQDGEFAQILRRHLFLRNPLGRGPASTKTPFITFGTDPFAASNRPWTVNPLDHDSQ